MEISNFYYHKKCSLEKKEEAYYYFRNLLPEGSLSKKIIDGLLNKYPTNETLIKQNTYNEIIEKVIEIIQKSQ
ncbi:MULTISPECIES: hypothetical protein [unclassified Tenacibaculum]|uniref:hypothetical protein n=1 Tax=unclassified Tenacibaculum TaxID=2635139 RepID=UPI001F4005FD|nr:MULTISPECIES: hypothetical protein [unclassified Tenacibaculum]MCF2874040.1 hypothetical protein [Tenacibaculum sp. Cn5-1]MCF2934621.1 hypothetical protein [Tenacibaculum sp. Cn5-34]MCG7510831.1 hypothetical protein [Tenacibaculum sp. Cn5-46]